MAEHQPLKTFICYAHEDRKAVEGLRKHLVLLEKKLILEVWDDGKILAGEEWDRSIKIRLESAEIVLMFISVDFINSDYIEKTELQAALQRHRDGKATLIPIIVRSCDWSEYFEIGKFQALPQQARPIQSSHFSFLDDAYHEVAQGIKVVALNIREKRLVFQRAAEEEAASQVRAERKRQLDEAAWATAVKEAKKSVTEREKIAAFDVYLDDENHILHRKEAEKRITELKASETKRKIEEKKKQEADREAEEKKERELEAEKNRKEEENRKKQQQEMRNPQIQKPVPLFPLYGITVGRTTVKELEKVGERTDIIDKDTGEPFKCFEVNGIDFWYNEEGIVESVGFWEDDAFPIEWQEIGFNWRFSYVQWLEFFDKIGYKVKIIDEPKIGDYQGKPAFEARFIAIYSLQNIRFEIELDFCYSAGISVNDKNTLWSIDIRGERLS